MPTETPLTWTDFGDRVAGVHFVDQDEVRTSHAGPEHWSTSIDHGGTASPGWSSNVVLNSLGRYWEP
ncbi:hypothetical protein [Mycobacteroides abscessus]|uniref:Uncharacterized protein n=2 Tax=Mycobacteroides abscessus TaxID=36809 RepID=A0A829QN91_9MYCO|nr:hypothetical protein [Mycobacteroides abscessus]EUA64237.1 hypothetical protein I542_4405 [Mycobacteroides abscessus 1948]AIC72980.1 hypothetical protein MYCMA_13015 [Mycobacteroides abscessus subsp. massiliense str. GO 06]ALM15235.1 hypothetical protein AOY11_02075 [Mycobacteroides abscessus]AMU24505.1 hypothetical protein A3N96_02940 [Mycobacteroides abscessus]AMU34234.1 hypothetical protein A3N98_02405 [Mycobacteroides abscessus]